MTKLTTDQRRAIQCVKTGHPPVIEMCLGQVTCARCGQVIGDALMGVFDTSDKILVGHDCDTCRALAEKLTPKDLLLMPPKVSAYLKRLRANEVPV